MHTVQMSSVCFEIYQEMRLVKGYKDASVIKQAEHKVNVELGENEGAHCKIVSTFLCVYTFSY